MAMLAFAPASADVYTNDFSTDPEWSAGTVANGEFVVNMTQWGRVRALGPGLWFINGTISCTAKATAQHPYGSGGCFGVVIKYNGSRHDLFVRFGAYDNISLGGDAVGAFSPVVGQTYQIDITVNGDQIGISIDGTPLPASPFTVDEVANEPGRVGFYTESSAAWDNIVVDGWEPNPKALPDPITGTSDLSLEFASYMADTPEAGEPFSVHGTIHAYLRNNGSGVAVLDNILLGGKSGNDLITDGLIGWYHQKPYFIEPGKVGELTLRVNGLTKSQTLAVMDDPEFENITTLTVVPTTGPQLKTIIPVKTKPEPLQINFMGFNQDLQIVYVYLQNNDKLYNGIDKEYTIKKVQVNGQDVTARTAYGSSKILDQVVPLVITLGQPLNFGEHTTVTVETMEGVRCGHRLRAIQSRFIINTPRFTQGCQRDYAGSAWDMRNHCNTAATWFEFDGGHEDELAKRGLDHLIYTGSGVGYGSYLYAMDSTPPEIVLNWVDEVDKETVLENYNSMAGVEKFYARDGTGYAFTVPNIIRPISILGKSYGEMWDGVAHSYGLGGLSYPVMDNLKRGEYRSSRRPFQPYYRDGEVAVKVDTGTMASTGLSSYTPRVITPEEMNIMLYGNMMLGAKGVHGYWGYGAQEIGSYYDDPGPMVRLGLGGITYPDTTIVAGYDIDDDILIAIKTTWDAIGYRNAEMQTIGPWVARSDVSYLGRIISVNPASAPNGHPAAETSALVSGLDTIILIVLNLNRNGVISYDPVNVTAGVTVPSWLQGPALEVFSVDSSDTPGITTETYTTVGNEMRFAYTSLAEKKVIVITSDSQARSAMAATMADMKDQLADIGTPVPPDPPPPRD